MFEKGQFQQIKLGKYRLDLEINPLYLLLYLTKKWMIRRLLLNCLCVFGLCGILMGQTEISGIVTDAEFKDPVIGATVIIKGTTIGTTTDWDGTFTLSVDLPATLEVSYIGYATKDHAVTEDSRVEVVLSEDAVVIDGVEVKATRISEKQKESPLTIEALDIIAIKETPAADFYDGLGALKGVDLTACLLYTSPSPRD